jgi:hypothetical protein
LLAKDLGIFNSCQMLIDPNLDRVLFNALEALGVSTALTLLVECSLSRRAYSLSSDIFALLRVPGRADDCLRLGAHGCWGAFAGIAFDFWSDKTGWLMSLLAR